MASSSEVVAFLSGRNSAPRLRDPGPGPEQLEQMLQCAMRSPDHAWLRPWRFVSIRGERRKAFGERLLESLLRSQPDADTAAREKALNAGLRAPLVIAVIAAYREHPKVPRWEQRISAGCAAYSLSLAAEALGFAAVWRTGAYANDAQLLQDLGGGADEEFVGFIYVGSRDGTPKAIPALDSQDFHQVF